MLRFVTKMQNNEIERFLYTLYICKTKAELKTKSYNCDQKSVKTLKAR